MVFGGSERERESDENGSSSWFSILPCDVIRRGPQFFDIKCALALQLWLVGCRAKETDGHKPAVIAAGKSKRLSCSKHHQRNTFSRTCDVLLLLTLDDHNDDDDLPRDNDTRRRQSQPQTKAKKKNRASSSSRIATTAEAYTPTAGRATGRYQCGRGVGSAKENAKAEAIGEGGAEQRMGVLAGITGRLLSQRSLVCFYFLHAQQCRSSLMWLY